MNFFSAIRACFDNYACIKGRASRTEYWSFVLFSFLVYGLIYLSTWLGFTLSTVWCLALFWTVISFLPLISVTVRRLNDAARSVGCVFAVLLPACLLFIVALLVRQKSLILMSACGSVALLLLIRFFYLVSLPSRKEH